MRTRLRAVSAQALAPDHPAHPSAPRIRRATTEDLAALVELENASFALDRMSERQWRRHLDSLSAEVFVATRERRLVGAAVLFFRRGSRVARLYSIAVAARARGHGIGERLLEIAENSARQRGARAIRLEVRADNAGAQRLYERGGYRRFGLHRGYYEGGHDALRYEKPLVAAAA